MVDFQSNINQLLRNSALFTGLIGESVKGDVAEEIARTDISASGADKIREAMKSRAEQVTELTENLPDIRKDVEQTLQAENKFPESYSQWVSDIRQQRLPSRGIVGNIRKMKDESEIRSMLKEEKSQGKDVLHKLNRWRKTAQQKLEQNQAVKDLIASTKGRVRNEKGQFRTMTEQEKSIYTEMKQKGELK